MLIDNKIQKEAIADLPENHIGLRAINGVIVPYVIETGAIIAGIRNIEVSQGVDNASIAQIEVFTSSDKTSKQEYTAKEGEMSDITTLGDKCRGIKSYIDQGTRNTILKSNNPADYNQHGVKLTIDLKKQLIKISGWFDDCMDIEGMSLDFSEMLNLINWNKGKK